MIVIMQLFWIRFAFLCCGVGLGEAAKATYYCKYTSNTEKKIIFNLDKESDTISAFYVKGKDASRCGSSSPMITGSGTQQSPYVLTIDLTNPIHLIDCGLQQGKNIYSFTLITQESASILKITDKQYFVECDMATPITSSTAGLQAISVAASSSPLTNGTVTKIGTPKMELLDYSTPGSPQVVTSAKLGANIKLRLTLTETVSAGPQGIWVGNCWAGSDNQFSKQIKFVGDKGCGVAAATIIDSKAGFKGSSEGRVAESPTFNMFQFPGVSTIAFKCQANFCFTKNEARCLTNNQCSTTRRKREVEPLLRRVKRGADPSFTTVTKTFLVRDDETLQDCISKRGNTGVIPSNDCFTSAGFLTTVTMLSLLVLISLATALIFYRRAVKMYRKQ